MGNKKRQYEKTNKGGSTNWTKNNQHRIADNSGTRPIYGKLNTCSFERCSYIHYQYGTFIFDYRSKNIRLSNSLITFLSS